MANYPRPTPSYCYHIIFQNLDNEAVDPKRLIKALLDDMDDDQVVEFVLKYGLEPVSQN